MSRGGGIPRISLTWLLVAQVLVILPHLGHLPLWIVALWLGCAGWRIQIFRMRAGYPNAWAKAGLSDATYAAAVIAAAVFSTSSSPPLPCHALSGPA